MKKITSDDDLIELRARLEGSFLLFTQTFFPLVTGREFKLSNPLGRESHFITIAKALTKVAKLEILSLLLNTPPGSAKSTLMSMWTAWTIAKYPNSQFLYISYSHELASKHTEFIKRIIETREYREVFGIQIRHDSRAKDFFQTNTGACVKAFGSSGSITGQDAGLPNCDHFTGAVIIDDAHKPDEVHSDTIREGVVRSYQETTLQRPRSPNVPIIYIGQRLHEADLPAYLLSGKDERIWTPVIIKSLNSSNHSFYPEVYPESLLLEKELKNPYVFASQFQQDPIPAGGALYKRENFVLLPEDPAMIATFLTVDTAETDKSYNDATVFHFWGIYKIVQQGVTLDQYALHSIDCVELRVEPKELETEFLSFYSECLLYPVRPLFAAIEKKTTGVTLLSVLQKVRGLSLREVKRTKASGSKTARFLEMQPIIASKLVSFTANAKHAEHVITHMMKITANNTHRHDDVCHSAGSKIATIYGDKNVEDIRVGDIVITPFGLGTVSAHRMTGHHKIINKLGLASTPDHKVFTHNGFLPLDMVCDDDKIDYLSFIGLLRWRRKSRLYLMDKNIHAESRDSIIAVAVGTPETNLYIKPFINFIAHGKYLKALMFTILTVIDLIIVLRIWSCYRVANTLKNIHHKLKLFKTWLKNGTKARGGENGIGKMVKTVTKNLLKKASQLVSYATKDFLISNLSMQNQKPAFCIATPLNIDRDWEISQQIAAPAEKNLSLKKDILSQGTEKHVATFAEETLVVPVYAITVKKYGVYYCNGILLKNCDTVYDAIKMALIDKSVMLPERESKQASIIKTLAAAQTKRSAALSRGMQK